MNRIIITTIATLTLGIASTSARAAGEKAPRVDSRRVQADRQYVRSLGILGMLQDGDATQSVLHSASIGSQLDQAMRGLKGQRFASTSAPSSRRGPAADRSVSIGALKVAADGDFELAGHRDHDAKTP